MRSTDSKNKTGNKAADRSARKFSAGKAAVLALAALITYCCLFSLIAKAVKGESLPMPLGFGAGIVITGSMEPTYSANDVVIVVKTDRINEGDVIAYQTGGTPVVHRVTNIDRESGLVTTRGDANNTDDPPITFSRIKGRVVFAIPKIGAVLKLVKTVPGMMMILTALATLLYLSLRSRDQEQQREIRQEELKKQIEELKDLIGCETDYGAGEEKNTAGRGEEPGEEADK